MDRFKTPRQSRGVTPLVAQCWASKGVKLKVNHKPGSVKDDNLSKREDYLYLLEQRINTSSPLHLHRARLATNACRHASA